MESTLQQYDLIEYEVESLKTKLLSSTNNITHKIIMEISVIKNPNEIIYDLSKKMYLILFGKEREFVWNSFQIEAKNFVVLKSEIENLIIKEISKEVIEECMNCYLNYEKIKEFIVKFNSNFIPILDVIKLSIEYTIKKGMKNNLYNTNINRNNKLLKIKAEITEKENLIKNLTDKLILMKEELSFICNSNENEKEYIESILMKKYKFIKKYRVFLICGEDKKTKINIKLKGKYASNQDFIKFIMSVNENNEMMGSFQMNSLILPPKKSRNDANSNKELFTSTKFRTTNNSTVFKDNEFEDLKLKNINENNTYQIPSQIIEISPSPKITVETKSEFIDKKEKSSIQRSNTKTDVMLEGAQSRAYYCC